MISGAKTCPEDHGYLTPPQVRPRTHADADAIIKTLPLSIAILVQCLKSHSALDAYIQSILPIFSRKEPRGVRNRRAYMTRAMATPLIGRFKSACGMSAWLRIPQDSANEQKSHLHLFSFAKAPPTLGPMPVAAAHVLWVYSELNNGLKGQTCLLTLQA